VGTIRPLVPVQFFASIIFGGSGVPSGVEGELSCVVGPIGEKTEPAPFSQSDYYCPEMGEGLQRYFVLFEPLSDRERLANIKGETNEMEQASAVGTRRAVNVDPGYMALEHVVLATTKGYAHRIYLGKGIFADLTLLYENGSYRALRWTYPDYGGDELIGLFNRWRERYKRLLRCQRA
jgi:hypothetical protein